MEHFAPLARMLFALVVGWVIGFYPLIIFYYARAYLRGSSLLLGPFFPVYIYLGLGVIATLSGLTLIVIPLSELGWYDTVLLFAATTLPFLLAGPLRRWSSKARRELAAERRP